MIRFFNKIIFILFAFAVVIVLLLLVSGEPRDKAVGRITEEAKASANISGRFLEHLISERIMMLYSAAYHQGSQEVLKQLLSYTDFVASTYAHKGTFMIGVTDGGFGVTGGYNSSEGICPEKMIFSNDIEKRLLTGKSYVGPASPLCAKNSSHGDSLMLMAVPIMDDHGFKGAVYELSTLLYLVDSKNAGRLTNAPLNVRIMIDDLTAYAPGSEDYKLLAMKNAIRNREAAQYNGRMAAFYSFYVHDLKLCLVYFKDIVQNSFRFECCPWLEDYKVFIFVSPVVLIVLWVILEMIRVNDRLGTEVKLRTSRLEALRKRYQGLFATIPEFIVLFRKDGEIQECNASFTEFLKGGNPVGANIIFMIKEKDRFRHAVESLEGDGTVNLGEFLLTGRDEQISVSVNACIVDVDGESEVLAAITDISEYKKMQNSFYLAQKREAVGTLAAGMVHDFSNILQNISLQYSLLERTNESERGKNMTNIKKILEGANKYLTGVLSYTKETKDSYAVKKGSVFISESIELLERVLPAEVDIVYEDFSGNIKIRAMQGKIVQMMINLCQNASDAMNGKGIIHIRTYVQDKGYGHFFCLSVNDSGVGIAQEDMDKIFKPFFTTKKDRGTGLGLATVRQVVLELGGFIEVYSNPGEGTEFVITLSESK